MKTFKAFTNALGDAGNRDTTTYAEFKTLALTLLPNSLIKRDAIEKEYAALTQKAAADKFVEQYTALVAKIGMNPLTKKLHTAESLLLRFQQKLKPKVQLHLAGKTFVLIEDAYEQAITADTLIFSSEISERQKTNNTSGRGQFQQQQQRGGSPWASRQGTPAPPQHISAMLAALDNYYGQQNPNAKPPPNGPWPSPNLKAPVLGAVEKDHRVPPGATVPRLTQEIQAWCFKHSACF